MSNNSSTSLDIARVDQNEANLFINLNNYLYERSSVILRSNKGPEECEALLGDQGITTMILDLKLSILMELIIEFNIEDLFFKQKVFNLIEQ